MAGSPPLLVTLAGIARRTGVHRTVALKMIAVGALAPDAYLEEGERQQPLFLEGRAVDVLRRDTPQKQFRRGLRPTLNLSSMEGGS